MLKSILSLSLLILTVSACDLLSSGDRSTSARFVKEVSVFGVSVRATASVTDEQTLHAATILAEYLDNNEDGQADNPAVVEALATRDAQLVLFASENELERFDGPFPRYGQDLRGDEIFPNGAAEGRFDASFEEVLHLITHVGYAHVYPDVFGEQQGSAIANAMDNARGGQFTRVPSSYPSDAWYTYDDTTCDYACQVTEYTYWALTSLLGAQNFPGRLAAIQQEWRLNTSTKVETQDPTAFALLTDPQYNLPTTLPDGVYTGGTLRIEPL